MTTPTTPDKIKALELLEAQSEEIRFLVDSIAHLVDIVTPMAETLAAIQSALSRPASAAPSPSEDPNDPGVVYFSATEINMTYNDKGIPVTRFKGGRFSKFGVMCWPETLAALGYNVADLIPGPNPIPPRNVCALLSDTGQPKKIIAASKST